MKLTKLDIKQLFTREDLPIDLGDWKLPQLAPYLEKKFAIDIMGEDDFFDFGFDILQIGSRSNAWICSSCRNIWYLDSYAAPTETGKHQITCELQEDMSDEEFEEIGCQSCNRMEMPIILFDVKPNDSGVCYTFCMNCTEKYLSLGSGSMSS